MRPVRILIFVICISAAGCVTSQLPTDAPPASVLAVAPGADSVTVTSNASVVASCTAVGDVFTVASAGTWELKNLAVGLHANVVLLTAVGSVGGKSGYIATAEGVAYRCDSSAPH